MIHTIRKHSKWLLWVITAVIIVAFLGFMGTVGTGGHGGRGSGVNTNDVSGKIYGQKVTQDRYDRMKDDLDLDFLFSYGQWPDHSAEASQQMLQRIYVRMMLVAKARQLGVHVTDDQAEAVAANFLHSAALERAFGLHDQPVPLASFVDRVLLPRNMGADDFENFVRDDLAIEQLQTLFGLGGELVTPQEVTNEYIRENQDYSAQIVFFSASNYLNPISVSPSQVGDYYTNYMADYRVPARVKVSYVLFSVTNHLGEAQREIGTTNLDMEVTNAFDRYGMQATPDVKTTNEALSEIRNVLLRRQALQDAVTQADDFAQSLFSMTPVLPQNLATAAREKGLTVEHPAPFTEDYGPSEFTAPAAFTYSAFHELTPDSPFSRPISGPNGVYILALETNLPSEIPPLDRIRGRVTEDLRMRVATLAAQRAGTNFSHELPVQMAAGKSFAAVGFAAGLDPLVLPPFSLSTQDIPDLDNHATLNQVKEATLTTPVGTASGFVQTDDGGFVLFVRSRLPVDQKAMAADMPQFAAQFRERQAGQAFNDWVQHEANRELRDTPLGRQMGMR